MKSENIFEIGVSYFHTLTTEVPVTAELYDLLTTDRYKDKVLAVRAEHNTATKKNLKNSLPSFTPSGIFERYGSYSPEKLTNFICVDIDKKDNLDVSDYGNLKERLSKVPYIAYCGLSCGGEGYFCIIPIVDTDLFRSHFRSLQVAFATMRITIDQACSDIGRKRFVSYDPEPYFNYQPETYEGLADNGVKHHNPHSPQTDVIPTIDEIAQADAYIEVIKRKKMDITYNYPRWFRIACAFANSFGEVGRERFHKVSQFYRWDDNKYDMTETDELYDSALKGNSSNPITLRTFLYYAREEGLDDEINWFEPIL